MNAHLSIAGVMDGRMPAENRSAYRWSRLAYLYRGVKTTGQKSRRPLTMLLSRAMRRVKVSSSATLPAVASTAARVSSSDPSDRIIARYSGICVRCGGKSGSIDRQ